MAKRHLNIAVLVGLLVGVLLGAGALRTAEVTADVLVARMDFVKRSQRTNEVYSDQGLQNPGVADARNTARTTDTRTEKGLRGAATARDIARGCLDQDESQEALSACLARAIKQAQATQSGN